MLLRVQLLRPFLGVRKQGVRRRREKLAEDVYGGGFMVGAAGLGLPQMKHGIKTLYYSDFP